MHQTISNTLLTTINNTSDLIWVFNIKGQFKVFNNAFKKIVEESFGIKYFDENLFKILESKGITAELIEIWNYRITNVVETEERVKFFDKFLINNQLHYFVTDVHPIFENQKITGLTCFSKDITSLNLVEKEKEELDQLNNSIVQSIDEIIFDYDISKNQITWNEAIFTSLGLNYKQLGTTLEAFAERLHECVRKQFLESFRNLFKNVKKLTKSFT